MHWKKGTSRKVLVIPALGICLKFARIQLWSALVETYRWLWTKNGMSVRHAIKYWSYPINDWGGRGAPSFVGRATTGGSGGSPFGTRTRCWRART